MNKYFFTGNLARDAEVRYTKGGAAVCSFTVAVKAGYGDNERTEWVKCALFGKRAEGKLPQYLTKGQQVLVEGEPSAEAWSDKQSGEAKGALSVFVKDLELVGGKSGNQPQRSESQHQAQQQTAASGSNFDDDIIPF